MFSRSSISFLPLTAVALSFMVLAYIVGLHVSHPFIALFAMGLVFTQGVFPFAFDLLHEARTIRRSQFLRTLGRVAAFGTGLLCMGALLALFAVFSVRVAEEGLHVDGRAIYFVSGAINVFAYVAALSGLGFIKNTRKTTLNSPLFGWLPGRTHAYMRAFWMGMHVLTARGVGRPLMLSLFASSLFTGDFLGGSVHYFAALTLGVVIALTLLATLARIYLREDLSPRFTALAPSFQHLMLWALVFAITRDVMHGFFVGNGVRFFEARVSWALLLGFPVLAYWAKEAWRLARKKAILTEAEWGNFLERTALVALVTVIIVACLHLA